MLIFNHISLAYQHKILLDDCSGTIQSGQRIVMTGLSGSGKSLLLKVLASLIPATQGQLTLHHQSFNDMSPAVWRSKIGFIQQVPELTEANVLANLQLPYQFNFYKNQSFDKNWHIKQLQRLGKNADFLQQSSQNLSGGERQFVNLLRCLQLSPEILLLDEPTSALDPLSRELVENLVLDWQADNPMRSLVWVSHDTQQIDKILSGFGIHWQMQAGKLCYSV